MPGWWIQLTAILAILGPVNCEGSVGCIFYEQLCDEDEWCYSDNAFGKCLPSFEPITDQDLYRHHLESSALPVFEEELHRLLSAGYKWSHAYTQCIMQNLLLANQLGLKYHPSVCSAHQSMDLHHKDVPKLAYIRFQPSSLDGHSQYADEWFIPPLGNRKSQKQTLYGVPTEFPKGLRKDKRMRKLSEGDPEVDVDSTNYLDIPDQVPNVDDNLRNYKSELAPEELDELINLMEGSPVQGLTEMGNPEDDYEDGELRSLNDDDWDIGFKRLHRYDVKKPGPNFMTDLGDFDSTEAVVNEQLNQVSLYKFLEEAMQNQENSTQPKNSRGFYAETMVDAAKDETSSDVESSQMPESVTESDTAEGQKEAMDLGAIKRQGSPRSMDIVASALPGTSFQNDDANSVANQKDIVDTSYAYITVKDGFRTWKEGADFVKFLEVSLSLPPGTFSNIRVEHNQVTFKVMHNPINLNASTVAVMAETMKDELQQETGQALTSAGIGDQVKVSVVSLDNDKTLFIVIFVVCGCVAGIGIAVAVLYVIRRHARSLEKLQNLAQPETEASNDYQDLCRQRMANKTNEKPEPIHMSQRVSNLSRESETSVRSPSSRSSTSSWSEEPVASNMDISTGHMVLAYMEDHLKNKDRLEQEWEALCAYEAEPCTSSAAMQPASNNDKKNRYADNLPYDHSRVILNDLTNVNGSDYINASTITDHDPRNPAYISTQGALPHTAADFWQMIWEQGSVVIVMLARLVENGQAMCHRYWPEEGSELHHIYEVHLVSEHIWCDDYLVRSFYLKNLKTGETRTVTQFHFLSWPDNGVPTSVKALLDFRRKVNKSYRGRSCPIVVHCSDGSGRSGTYCLIDMVLNRMAKGAKEIDIAATLEHIRDQRPQMVKTKAQFEFALTAVAEEVHAILKALPQ